MPPSRLPAVKPTKFDLDAASQVGAPPVGLVQPKAHFAYTTNPSIGAKRLDRTSTATSHPNQVPSGGTQLAALSTVVTKVVPLPQSFMDKRPASGASSVGTRTSVPGQGGQLVPTQSPSALDTSQTEEKKEKNPALQAIADGLQASSTLTSLLNSSCIPATYPATKCEAKDSFGPLVDNRDNLLVALQTLDETMVRLSTENVALSERHSAQSKEIEFLKKEVAECSDNIFAADGRIGILQDQLSASREAMEQLQRDFDARIVLLVQTDSMILNQPQALKKKRQLEERYRNEDIMRLETEIKGLQSQLARVEKFQLEKEAHVEKINRLVSEHDEVASAKQQVDDQNHQLIARGKELILKMTRNRERYESEMSRLVTETNTVRKHGNSIQRERVSAALEVAFVSSSVRAQTFRKWILFAQQRHQQTLPAVPKPGLSMSAATLMARSGSGNSNRRLLLSSSRIAPFEPGPTMAEEAHQAELKRLREEQLLELQKVKKDAALQVEKLEGRINTQLKEMLQLRAELEHIHANPRAFMKQKLELQLTSPQATPKPSTLQPPPTNSPGGMPLAILSRPSSALLSPTPDLEGPEQQSPLGAGWSSTDLQTKALEMYNLLHPVIGHVKDRLGLSVMTPPLKLYTQSTESVVTIVFQWVLHNYRVLHLLLSLDDRLRKAKSRLTFISLSIRPKLKKLYDKSRFVPTENVSAQHVIQKRIASYEGLMRSANGMRSRIDATRLSLKQCKDHEKQQEVAALASSFEADLQEFQRKVKMNESVQFALSLEFTKKAPGRILGQFHKTQQSLKDEMMSKSQRILGGPQSTLVSNIGTKSKFKRPDAESVKMQAEDPSIESTAATAGGGSSPPLHGRRAKSTPLVVGGEGDNHEKGKHHLMYIGSVLPADSKGRLDLKAFARLAQEENQNASIRKALSVGEDTSEMQKTRGTLLGGTGVSSFTKPSNEAFLKKKKAVTGHYTQKNIRQNDPNFHPPTTLKGPMEHFIDHSSAIIPFRPNTTRTEALHAGSTGTDAKLGLSLAETLMKAVRTKTE